MRPETHGDLPLDVRKRIKSVQDATVAYFAEQMLKLVTSKDVNTPAPSEFAEGILHGTFKGILVALKGGGYSNNDIREVFDSIGKKAVAVGEIELDSYARFEAMMKETFGAEQPRFNA